MLFSLLFSNTLHFALMLITVFVFLSGALLHFDSWQLNKRKKTLLVRSLGFLLLASAADVHAAQIVSPLILTLMQFAKVVGLTILLASFIEEPILVKPRSTASAFLLPLLSLPFYHYAFFPLTSALFFIIALVCTRKVIVGLEKDFKLFAISMFFLGLSELIQVAFFWSDTPLIFWSQLLAEYGPLWMLQQGLHVLGISLLGYWVWGYIRFRLELQLFVTTAALSLTVFFVSAVYFTFLLLRNLETDALAHLKTDISLLGYALTAKQNEALTQAEYLSSVQRIQNAVLQQDKKALSAVAEEFVAQQKIDQLIIASTSGEVLYRSQDNERTNDVLSEDVALQAVQKGIGVTSFFVQEGVIAPQVYVEALTPIYKNGEKNQPVIGLVVASFIIDNAFVDGVKEVTGLDVTVFGGAQRAATTFVSFDGTSRNVGTFQSDEMIHEKVLNNGELFLGKTSIFQQPFYAAYAPVDSFENKHIGMLFVGKPQRTLLDAARQAITLMFNGSLIFVIFSLVPAYFYARFIKEHTQV